MTDDIREAAIEAAARQLHGYIAPQLAQEVARAAIAAYERAMWRPAKDAPIGRFVIGTDRFGMLSLGFKTPDRWVGIEISKQEVLHCRLLPLPPEDEA